MAQVKIKNTREHEIHLNLPHKAPVVIPAAKQAEEGNKLVPGQAMVDEEVLDALKDNPVVNHYFDAGWLVKPSAGKPESKSKQKD